MEGLMIALYAIAGLVAVIILIWFVMTLTSIDKGIRNIGDALWKMAGTFKDASDDSLAVKEAAKEEYVGLLKPSEREKLKAIENIGDLKIFWVIRREIENDGNKLYKLDLSIRPDGVAQRIMNRDIRACDFTKLEIDKKYTREELKL